MRKLIAVLAAGTALAGCATNSAVVSAPPVEADQAPPPVVAPAPKAAIGTFGFEVPGMDRTVQPGD
jgi:putative endopeptidase